jgi:hypothetical protein
MRRYEFMEARGDGGFVGGHSGYFGEQILFAIGAELTVFGLGFEFTGTFGHSGFFFGRKPGRFLGAHLSSFPA